MPWEAIAARIAAATGTAFHLRTQRHVGGGCINTAAILSDGARQYFVKINQASRLAMLEAEQAGLEALAAAGAIRVPRPLCTGVVADHSFLAMESLDLSGRLHGARAGVELANLHQTAAPTFGWHRDNTIGSTPQCNTPSADWVAFWRDCRLGRQLAIAAANGYGGRLQASGARLMADLASLLPHQPRPSLLHGDLWGGNIGSLPDGQPVIFDPAVYFGDREADLAMTELFGGFDRDFYAAYQATWSLDPGYGVRKQLYNLYHVLNHLNLFGGGYLAQAQGMMDRLLAEIR